MNITGALDYLRDELKRAGLDASADPQHVPIPGAWLQADGLNPLTLHGDHELRVNVHLVAPDHGTIRSLEQLQKMLDKALTVITPRSTIELDGYVDTPRGRLPAFTIPTTLDI